MSLAVGNIVEGVVTGITKFGAFVELPGGITGLIHISEVADTYVKDVNDFLKEKQQVKVKVINIGDDGKIGLSIKQLNASPRGNKNRSKGREISFEDKMAKFLKESDERQQDLRRNTESKRGGRAAGRI
ncbi:MAG TPA: S1 RNA-binding domain-containing protein [Clostridia bacterium]|jgi:S1 RNA binding domain protein|nr:S1 RNA-binding domain-containing protein [Clostridia bacterium]